MEANSSGGENKRDGIIKRIGNEFRQARVEIIRHRMDKLSAGFPESVQKPNLTVVQGREGLHVDVELAKGRCMTINVNRDEWYGTVINVNAFCVTEGADGSLTETRYSLLDPAGNTLSTNEVAVALVRARAMALHDPANR